MTEAEGSSVRASNVGSNTPFDHNGVAVTQSCWKYLNAEHDLLILQSAEIKRLNQSLKQSNDELDQTRQHLSLLGSEANRAREDLTEKLNASDKELSKANKSVNQLTQAVTDLEVSLTESQESLAEAEEELDEANEIIESHHQPQSLVNVNWTELLEPVMALELSDDSEEAFLNNLTIVKSAIIELRQTAVSMVDKLKLRAAELESESKELSCHAEALQIEAEHAASRAVEQQHQSEELRRKMKMVIGTKNGVVHDMS